MITWICPLKTKYPTCLKHKTKPKFCLGYFIFLPLSSMPPPLSFFFHTIYVKILCIDAFLSSHFHSVLDPRTQGHKLWGDLSRTAGWCFRVNLFRIFLFMYIHFVVFFKSSRGPINGPLKRLCFPSLCLHCIYLFDFIKRKDCPSFRWQHKKLPVVSWINSTS